MFIDYFIIYSKYMFKKINKIFLIYGSYLIFSYLHQFFVKNYILQSLLTKFDKEELLVAISNFLYALTKF